MRIGSGRICCAKRDRSCFANEARSSDDGRASYSNSTQTSENSSPGARDDSSRDRPILLRDGISQKARRSVSGNPGSVNAFDKAARDLLSLELAALKKSLANGVFDWIVF